MNYVPDFMEDAMNVYRTRDYIVKQVVGVKYSEVEDIKQIPVCTFLFQRRFKGVFSIKKRER